MAKYCSCMSLAKSMTVLLCFLSGLRERKIKQTLQFWSSKVVGVTEHTPNYKTGKKVLSPETTHKNQTEAQRRTRGRRGNGVGPRRKGMNGKVRKKTES